jgi:hypothetical protein
MTASLLVMIGAVAVAQAYLTSSFAGAYVEAQLERHILRGRHRDPEKIISIAVQITALISLLVTAVFAAFFGSS